MPRASGNDLCEIFGFSPEDTSDIARKQWKSQNCPFVGDVCVKHSHPDRHGKVVVYGSCSVLNRGLRGKEEVIICPQRLYADNYRVLRHCAMDAMGHEAPFFLADQYSALKASGRLPGEYIVLLGQKSGKEISVSNPGVIDLSFDWIMAYVANGNLELLFPCEVQSIDTTGNYRANWQAYSKEAEVIPDAGHGMNWANVWKRLIPQLILKGAISSTSRLCKRGQYFVVPDRVYQQFEKLLGHVAECNKAADGVLTVMTYSLGAEVAEGKQRDLVLQRTKRMLIKEFARAFGSGQQLPPGSQLDEKVLGVLAAL